MHYLPGKGGALSLSLSFFISFSLSLSFSLYLYFSFCLFLSCLLVLLIKSTPAYFFLPPSLSLPCLPVEFLPIGKQSLNWSVATLLIFINFIFYHYFLHWNQSRKNAVICKVEISLSHFDLMCCCENQNQDWP